MNDDTGHEYTDGYNDGYNDCKKEREAELAALRGLLGRAAVAVEWGINDEYDHHAKGTAAVLLQEINAALKEEGK